MQTEKESTWTKYNMEDNQGEVNPIRGIKKVRRDKDKGNT